ncbi:hypothetical protein O0I10_002649 [Lichtheimia ornata]|uniref:Uncharacterized protein n=1 Tax=Lichtheimia ornata TaxID=688661 RepID=A0AAD7V8M4_9FUNG|nr:uncharacterized protein O0I10_002649 [Lichtheimia ornata]KAJ8661383.1 hypothetical protein O0I10_002649 [Lichtheimia ornata]
MHNVNGRTVVNGDTFSYNKHVRDLPMTQASIPIQHVNMLDDGTSGSNKSLISKQERCMVGSMVCVVFDLQSETCELTRLTVKQQQDNMDDMEIRLYLRH